jgi:WD40 repeat protein
MVGMIKRLGFVGLIIAALLVMACGDGGAFYPNRDGVPNNCEYTDGAYYQPNHFARFDNNNHRLLLMDWNTGESIFELDTNIDAANTSVLEWSPNCQYLITHQNGTGVFYDVINGKRLGSFEQMRGYNRDNPSVVFDATSSFVTLEAGKTTYLYNLLTGGTYPLENHYFQLEYWDMVRKQLVTISNQEAAAYDLNNGAKVISFGKLNLAARPGMIFSPDYSTLAFHSNNHHVYVINRDTLAQTDVNIGFHYRGGEQRLALSPDNRWLVSAGEPIYAWDLQNLTKDDDGYSPPIFQFYGPTSIVHHVQFVNAGTIETVTDSDTTYWDFQTGAPVNP